MAHQTNDDIYAYLLDAILSCGGLIAKAISRDCFVPHVITISKQDDDPDIEYAVTATTTESGNHLQTAISRIESSKL